MKAVSYTHLDVYKRQTLHNAVMHAEDESAGENVILEVFQKGFRIGEKVVRFAMVKVAN